MPAATIKALVGDRIWNDYYKFCVIRNPFDKLVSAYHGVRTRKRREDGAIEKGGFRGELLEDPENLREDFEDWLRTDILPPDRNKYLIDEKFCLDDVIKYENLLEDIERISKRLAIAFTPERLPQLKAGRRPDWPLRNYYTSKSVEIVANTFQFELETFGYSPPI
jgi:hypothetical protein